MLHSSKKKLLSPVWGHLSDVVVARAAGSYIHSVDGKKYLDFTCGIGVTNTGHCHPRVVKAAQDQCEKLIHGQINIVWHEPALELAGMLKEVVPAGLDTFFFSNSGAEAVEAAVKLARHATSRQNVIAFQGGFHGRTNATMALSMSKTVYRRNYGPLMSGVLSSPYAYCHHCPVRRAGGVPAGDECCGAPLEQLETLLLQQTDPSETAAILLEPVLGEGGYVVPPKSFIEGVRQVCDKHGILMIADEVQSGFGRTGEYFAMDHFGVVPDILVMAKGIASGFPLSGVASRAELMERWLPGSHGGTYGPNAVACAAAVATQQVIQEEALVAHAARQGARLMRQLRDLQAALPCTIADVRGLGLMVGVEFDRHAVPKGFAAQVSQACVERGLLLLNAGAFETVRFIPALNVSDAELDEGLALFTESLRSQLPA